MPCLAMAPDEVDRPALVEAAARGAAAAGGSRQVVAAAVAAAIRAAATLGAAETADVFGSEHAPSPIQAEIILAAREAHDLLARQLGVPHHSLSAAVRAARADGAVDRSLADRLNRLSVASDILRHTTAMGVSKLLGDLRMVLKQGHRKEPKGQGAQPKHEEKAAAKLVAEEDLTRLVAEAQEKAAAKPAAANEQPQDDVPAADGPAADEAAENAKPEERSKQEKKAAAEKAAGEMAARCAAAEEKAARCAAINERVGRKKRARRCLRRRRPRLLPRTSDRRMRRRTRPWPWTCPPSSASTLVCASPSSARDMRRRPRPNRPPRTRRPGLRRPGGSEKKGTRSPLPEGLLRRRRPRLRATRSESTTRRGPLPRRPLRRR